MLSTSFRMCGMTTWWLWWMAGEGATDQALGGLPRLRTRLRARIHDVGPKRLAEGVAGAALPDGRVDVRLFPSEGALEGQVLVAESVELHDKGVPIPPPLRVGSLSRSLPVRITDAASRLDIQLSDVWAQPYDLYRRLHDLNGMARGSQPMMADGAWLAVRHADVTQVLKDAKVFRSDARSIGLKNPLDAFWVPSVMKAFARSMVMADGTDHRRLRRLANKAFTPTRVAGLAPHIEEIS